MRVKPVTTDTRMPMMASKDVDIKTVNKTLRDLMIKLQAMLHEYVIAINAIIRGECRFHYYEVVTSEPLEDEKRQGLVVYADGTTWNPGSGEGLYRWTGAAWVYIG